MKVNDGFTHKSILNINDKDMRQHFWIVKPIKLLGKAFKTAHHFVYGKDENLTASMGNHHTWMKRNRFSVDLLQISGSVISNDILKVIW